MRTASSSVRLTETHCAAIAQCSFLMSLLHDMLRACTAACPGYEVSRQLLLQVFALFFHNSQMLCQFASSRMDLGYPAKEMASDDCCTRLLVSLTTDASMC